ncbi:MAG: 3-deoxy-manno-octulosonate cytidylyltransferase [Desulfuromonadaceae bacterium]|nr:3-deoxy-manno-octulosonate cytidylyltransferase [Desulfuromonadaceae bacterium]
MRITAIIPARFASTRFPGKPLVKIAGKTMIERVYERVGSSATINRVIVATDDQRIYQAVTAFGGEAWMTREDHASGTDRLAEVAHALEADLVVNVQGDEPLIAPSMIDAAVAPLRDDPSIPMGTLKAAISDWQEFRDPNVVKVVTDHAGDALYFSRSPIPFPREEWQASVAPMADLGAFKHIGLYVYRRDFLLRFAAMPESRLEQLEKLEQLRALEHGYRIRVIETDQVCIGVDTPEDVPRVERLLKSRNIR